ncbi:hypothetical protein KDW95_08775 [Marinobacterium rhizophilum]|jgi:hypothetical protein|uniref:Uncharacterized protein n=2 Tax=Marinobacterium rhizophilum TaxID=420402 RepID=A0ABY5HRB7_9GAMM|nr:hypothetical protein KDW95_08775 [Marinobacterium rhizophilum]
MGVTTMETKLKTHPKFVEAMQKLSGMTEEERLSEENKALFDQAIRYAPLDIQPKLAAIQRKYEALH